jgi:hypothetical protein
MPSARGKSLPHDLREALDRIHRDSCAQFESGETGLSGAAPRVAGCYRVPVLMVMAKCRQAAVVKASTGPGRSLVSRTAIRGPA